MLSYVMQPYPCVTWQFAIEIPNIKMFMGSVEQAVIPTESPNMPVCQHRPLLWQTIESLGACMSLTRSSFLGASQPFISGANKAKAVHSQTIKNSNCVYRARTSRGPIKCKNTQSPCPEIRGYQAEEFWITPWLLISMCTHGLTQSNTAAKSLTSWTRT